MTEKKKKIRGLNTLNADEKYRIALTIITLL